MRRLLASAGIAAVATVAALFGGGSAPAYADPPPPWADPHYPDAQHGNCVGGHGGAFGFGYWDGAHYPDGSYRHQITNTQGGGTRPQCVVDNGSLQPPPAPPGGCGGNAYVTG